MGPLVKTTDKPPFALEGIDDILLLISGWRAQDDAELRRHLARHRVEIVEEGVHGGSRGEILSLYARDPSGNVIEVKGRPPA
jgi:hypothetical protein